MRFYCYNINHKNSNNFLNIMFIRFKLLTLIRKGNHSNFYRKLYFSKDSQFLTKVLVVSFPTKSDHWNTTKL